MLSGRRIPSSSANFSAGMILPRAIPAMSGMIASTSSMEWSRKNCWISLDMRHRHESPQLRALETRCAERREDRSRESVAHHLPLGMPLHCDREAAGALYAKGLDETVRRASLHGEIGAQPIDTL